MERYSVKKPGYDCKFAPCKHDPPGDHGIAGEEWWYVVKDGDRAVAVNLLTTIFPPTVPKDWVKNMKPTEGAISTHHTWQEADYETSHEDCEWLDGKTCYGDVGFLMGKYLWERHGHNGKFEQSEKFWKALEAHLPERPKPAPTARVVEL